MSDKKESFKDKSKKYALRFMAAATLLLGGKDVAQAQTQDKNKDKSEMKKEFDQFRNEEMADFEKFRDEMYKDDSALNKKAVDKKSLEEQVAKVKAKHQEAREAMNVGVDKGTDQKINDNLDESRLQYYNKLLPQVLNFIEAVDNPGKAVSNPTKMRNQSRAMSHAVALSNKDKLSAESYWKNNFGSKGIEIVNIKGADFVSYKGHGFGILKNGSVYSISDVQHPAKLKDRAKFASSIVEKNDKLNQPNTNIQRQQPEQGR